jgi:RNA polymerase sigma-54 factor
MTDEAGYLRGDLGGLAELLGAPLELVEETLRVMQGFDPCGVFARDLRECLTLQLKEQDRCDPAMAAMIENINLLAVHDLAALRRAARVSDEDLMDMIQEVRRLNPKPGLKYGSAPTQPIVPDVLVRALPDGSFHVELNSDTLPRVLVNQTYYATVSKSTKRKEDRSYLVDCLQTANWLVKSLDQRARTILKVAQEIVRQQDAFLTYGVRHLRPLNLKTVADAISMHESTVSRVTANKYMATNRGLFELKYFFTSAIAATSDGDAHSSESVRDRIRAMIEAEPAGDVLSDDKIVDRLKGDGIDIARRTVAKYREALRIPSSVQRRRLKRIALGGESLGRP